MQHMRDEAAYLVRAGAGLDQAAFVSDETLKRAAVRSIEVMGEAAKGVDDAFRAKHPQVPWRALAGMRDRLIHGYFGVDYDIVWDVLRLKAPELKRELDALIAAHDQP